MEMLNEATMRLYFTITTMENKTVQNLTIPNFGENMKQPEISYIADE